MLRSSAFPAFVVVAGLVACSSSETPPPRLDAGNTGGGAGGASGGASTGGKGGGGAASSSGGAASSSGGAPSSSAGATASGGRDGSAGAAGGGAGGGATSTGGSAPVACPASDEGNAATGRDTFVPNTGKSEAAAITYTNVGATGAYAEVISGWSKATGCNGDSSLCETQYKREKRVSGALAPFNEEMTLVFAGPIELYQIAVYAPEGTGWTRRAYWDRCSTEGLVFAGNKHWFECNGFVESYVTADGTKESAAPVQFSGKVAAGVEVHVMSSELCSGSGCGYSSGLPIHGFGGDSTGSKIFATKLRMPIGTKTPAYWILPSQVIRSSQYGCNCRGMGSDAVYKGGCGELDVAEILGGVVDSLEATSTLYSFQDITGGGSVAFNRPVHESATFVVIFDAPSRQIAIRRLGTTEFDFATSLPSSLVSGLLAEAGAVRALD
jgi:hypothetical protein